VREKAPREQALAAVNGEQNRYGDARFVQEGLVNSWQMKLPDLVQPEMEEVSACLTNLPAVGHAWARCQLAAGHGAGGCTALGRCLCRRGSWLEQRSRRWLMIVGWVHPLARPRLQVFRVNAVAPCLLVQQLAGLLTKSRVTPYIINVHAREGARRR
jgi:hypothetical protein